jgi:DNA-binding NarL/FixJ family response regulator
VSPTSPSSPTRYAASATAKASSTPIVFRLVARRRADPPLELTEREALALMAEGHSNDGIGERLFLRLRTVETHIRQIFLKLRLRDTPAYHRRVVAVPTFLRSN